MDSSTQNRLQMVTKGDSFDPVDGRAGLLLECATDGTLPCDPDYAVPLTVLTGPYEVTKRQACEIVQRLIAGEPSFEGILHLQVIEESLAQIVERILHSLHLDRWLRDHKISDVHFRSGSTYLEGLLRIKQLFGAPYHVHRQAPVRPPKHQRFLEELRNRGLRKALQISAEHLFPCHARFFMRQRSIPNETGGTWFYSTAHTFTNICLAYQPFVPGPSHWLFESSGTSFGPLNTRGIHGTDIYAYGRWTDIPPQRICSDIGTRLVEHLSRQGTSTGDERIQALLIGSDVFQNYLRVRLPLLMFHSRLFSRFLDKAKPEMVIVGNPGMERPLLQLAHARGVPTVALQHGILGDYYQHMEQPCDELLVRGEFWKQFVAEPMRSKTRILNLPREDVAGRTTSERTAILFLSAVESVMSDVHSLDTRDIIRTLLKVASDEQRKLIIRVHPMEPIPKYRDYVESELAALKTHVPVEYSQGEGLDHVLEQAAVAVMYASTVFLDCIRLRIPVVGFGWHEFSYKSLIEKHRVFSFAEDLQHLRELTTTALHGELDQAPEIGYFLSPTAEGELQEYFQGMLNCRKQAARG